jgi:hypothetical protein
MERTPRVFLNLNGIPSEKPPISDEVHFSFDPQGVWRPSHGDLSFEVEAECVQIRDALAEAIFGNLEAYYGILRVAPEFAAVAGLNSESTMSRSDLERCVGALKEMPVLNQLLYLYDCRRLVASIQECTKEVLYLLGEFYRALNLDPLFYPPMKEPDGTRWLTSPIVTNIYAVLSFIFVRLHSLLDYTTKLAFEMEHLRTDFSSYPRLASSNILFSDRKRISYDRGVATLFEPCELIAEVELYRNLIIHDGLLDDMPKAYKVIEHGQAVEKFILLPDRGPEGRLERFKNRNLFYSREDKINRRLPALVNAFQARQVVTLKLMLEQLNAKSAETRT